LFTSAKPITPNPLKGAKEGKINIKIIDAGFILKKIIIVT